MCIIGRKKEEEKFVSYRCVTFLSIVQSTITATQFISVAKYTILFTLWTLVNKQTWLCLVSLK